MDVSLRDLGWSAFFSDAFDDLDDPTLSPGRVIVAGGESCRVATADGELRATPAGRLRHGAAHARELPAVGDWVALRRSSDGAARLERVLPRRTTLSRRAAGRRDAEQIVAANVDIVLVVMGLDGDFNLRRLERLLAAARESGARPVVLLNKLDLCAEPASRLAAVEAVAGDAPVLLTSCADGRGLGAVRAHLAEGTTAVLVGSSGAGKSSLINRLLARAAQTVHGVREGDDRGRHTTTHRELFRVPGGGMVIDNPGIRELQLWGAETGVERTFDEVAVFAAECRFSDCTHESEPGCAVRDRLDPARLESYHKLRKELAWLELRRDVSAQQAQKRRWRAIHRALRRSRR